SWERLYDNLPLTTKDKKIVIIFISQDWNRGVWQVSQSDLECLRSPVRCTGANNFIGLPNDPVKAEAQIRRIAAERIQYYEEKQKQNILKESATYQRLLRPAYNSWWPFRTNEDVQIEKNKLAIQRMVNSVGKKNILFIDLPTTTEPSEVEHRSS